jgi:hypothetical protein
VRFVLFSRESYEAFDRALERPSAGDEGSVDWRAPVCHT